MHFRPDLIDDEADTLERLRVMLHRRGQRPRLDPAELDRLRAGMGNGAGMPPPRQTAPTEPPAGRLARYDV